MDFDALLEPHRNELEFKLNARMLPLARAGSARLQDMASDQLRSGGKRLRGLLPVALVQAGQGPMAAAFELGACIEWVHNGTLVHDDIQDGDELRRGQPTLWTIHGIAQAINAGDAMLVGPLAALLRAEAIPPDLRAPLAGLLADALLETIHGQVADLALRDLEAGPSARSSRRWRRRTKSNGFCSIYSSGRTARTSFRSAGRRRCSRRWRSNPLILGAISRLRSRWTGWRSTAGHRTDRPDSGREEFRATREVYAQPPEGLVVGDARQRRERMIDHGRLQLLRPC